MFTKVGRQVQPTAAAAELFQSVSTLLAGLESSFDLVSQLQTGVNVLTVVAGMRMMYEDLVEPLRSFQDSYSGRLVLQHGTNRQAEEAVLSGEADIGLALQPDYKDESPQVIYEPAYRVDFLAIAHRQHPFARAKSDSLEEIVKHDLVVTAPGSHGREALERALHKNSLKANIVVETDNSGFTIACVQAQMGLGVLAGRESGLLCRNLHVRSLRKELGGRQIVFMVRKGRQLPSRLKMLMDCIRGID